MEMKIDGSGCAISPFPRSQNFLAEHFLVAPEEVVAPIDGLNAADTVGLVAGA
jgi:hypothetical protein